MIKGEDKHDKALFITSLDQVLSSASNFAFLLLLALTSSGSTFALTTTLWTLISFSVVLARSVFGIPLLLDFAKPEDYTRQKLAGGRLGYLFIGTPVLVCTLMISIFSSDDSKATWVIAAMVPLIMVQDHGRYVAISTGQSRRALISDLIMLTPVAIGLVLLWGDQISLSATDSSALLLSGLFAAAAYLCKSWLIDFSYENLKETTSSDWNRRKKLFIDSFLISMTAVGSIACIWIGFGSEGAAQFNGALTALAPIGLATLVAQLSLQKSLAQSRGQIKSQDILLTTLLLGASIVWTFAISSLSPSLGLLILGENWITSQKVLIALGTLLIVNFLIEALAIFARSYEFFDAIILRRKLVLFFTAIIFIAIGILEMSLQTAIYTNALASFVILCTWLVATKKQLVVRHKRDS
jgi:hypothetical protein